MRYHYNDVMMSAMSSQITSLSIVYSTVYSRRRSRKHQSSASLAFVRGIHQWPVNCPHKGPVTRKMFPFDDVIMVYCKLPNLSTWQQVAFSVKMVWYIHETYRRLHHWVCQELRRGPAQDPRKISGEYREWEPRVICQCEKRANRWTGTFKGLSLTWYDQGRASQRKWRVLKNTYMYVDNIFLT